MSKKLQLLDIPVYNTDREGILDSLFSKIRAGDKFQIITFNALMLNHAFENPSFFKLLKAGECVNDSIGILLAGLLLKSKLIERFQGIELFHNLVRFAADKGFPIFIYGAKEEVNAMACIKLKEMFPELNICGRLDGYSVNAAKIIKKAKPKILFAALDSPRQEEWLHMHLPGLNCTVMGIGGSLDVIAGKVKRVNPVFRAMGAEWLGRLIMEPWRFWRILQLPVFLARILKIQLFKK